VTSLLPSRSDESLRFSNPKVVLAVGEDKNKLKVCHVWENRKMAASEAIGSLSRQSSLSRLARRGSLTIR